jgi:hypothetical protein
MWWIGNPAGCVVRRRFCIQWLWAMPHSKSQFLMMVATGKMNATVVALAAMQYCAIGSSVCQSDLGMNNERCHQVSPDLLVPLRLFRQHNEHSIADMTMLQIALLGNYPDTVSWGGLAYSLFRVTAETMITGPGVMGVSHWYISRPAIASATPISGGGRRHRPPPSYSRTSTTNERYDTDSGIQIAEVWSP